MAAKVIDDVAALGKSGDELKAVRKEADLFGMAKAVSIAKLKGVDISKTLKKLEELGMSADDLKKVDELSDEMANTARKDVVDGLTSDQKNLLENVREGKSATKFTDNLKKLGVVAGIGSVAAIVGVSLDAFKCINNKTASLVKYEPYKDDKTKVVITIDKPDFGCTNAHICPKDTVDIIGTANRKTPVVLTDIDGNAILIEKVLSPTQFVITPSNEVKSLMKPDSSYNATVTYHGSFANQFQKIIDDGAKFAGSTIGSAAEGLAGTLKSLLEGLGIPTPGDFSKYIKYAIYAVIVIVGLGIFTRLAPLFSILFKKNESPYTPPQPSPQYYQPPPQYYQPPPQYYQPPQMAVYQPTQPYQTIPPAQAIPPVQTLFDQKLSQPK